MQVRLKVMQGTNTGKEIKLPVSQFVIGRGDNCHLRPRSDAVSRQHCAIVIYEEEVILRDFGSKNGTYINDERVDGKSNLINGDELRIGPLRFQVLMDSSLSGAKRPAAKDVKEVAARTAETRSEEFDINDWLEDDPEDTTTTTGIPDTRQFRLDETDKLALETTAESGEEETLTGDNEDTDGKKRRWKKVGPGKLPKRPVVNSSDSREAAADMLRKFFNRR